MNKKRALITGISGQDGSYLAEYLLEIGYDVYGIVRRHSTTENQQTRLENIRDEIDVSYGDVTDSSSITRLVKQIMPDEIYNLAAQSHVRVSFELPKYTLNVNASGLLNVLEAVRLNSPHSRVYQASSSEMFGNSIEPGGSQNEKTPMHPVSPYGVSKLAAYNLIKSYRESYGIFACNGILFNHESPRRGSNFVTNKIAKAVANIHLDLQDKLVLGNLDAQRDWGHSYDYVRAMHLINNHDEPKDFVVATNETRSIRDFLEIAFSFVGLDYKNFVSQDERYMRPNELNYLRGDSSLFTSTFNWKRKYTFQSMVEEMIQYWISQLEN